MANSLNNKLIKLFGKSNLAFTLTMAVILFAFIAVYLTLPSYAAPNLTADFSNNGSVGNEDFIILKGNWAKTSATHNMGDANDDGTINIYDLSILASEWGQTSTPTPTPTGQPANSINVKDYGAKGDGATSDNSSILATVSAAKGAVVYFPAGTYKLSGILTVPNGTTFVGEGQGVSWVNGRLAFGSNSSFTNLKIGDIGDYAVSAISGASTTTFVNCYFYGGRDWNGIITLIAACHDIIFNGCTIGSGAMNGVTIVDKDGFIYNITFNNCHFLTSFGMSIECLGRPVSLTGGYYGINITGCTFEPAGFEAISFDDDGHGLAGNCIISNNIIKGAGVNWSSTNPWGQGLEVNGPKNMTVTHNTIYQTKRELLNLQWYGTNNSGWNISDNILDNSINMGGPVTISGVNSMGCINVYGGVFARNVVTSASPGGVPSFNNCHNMDWRTTTFIGGVPWQGNGSSGNLF